MSSTGYRTFACVLVLSTSTLALVSCDKSKQNALTSSTEWSRSATGDQLANAIFPSASSFNMANVGMLKIPQTEKGGDTPLATESLEVRVFLVGRMAKTEVKQVFRNHTSRQTEGTYTFRLPENASLSRLAMDVEGKMVEGELVEREKARMIYEGIVRKQKDPALLEWTGNNRFSTQLFPIPAKGTKTVVLTYEQMLPAEFGQLSYHYSLPDLKDAEGVDKIGKFTFMLESEDGLNIAEPRYGAKIEQRSVGGQVAFEAADFTPSGNVQVNLRMKQQNIQQATVRTARRGGRGYFLADLPINLPGEEKPDGAKDFIFAIDTSAGAGKPVVEQSLATVRTFIERASKDARFSIITGDFEVKVCGEKLSANAALACLKDIEAGGASDLGKLVQMAGMVAQKIDGPSHTFLVGDGVASIGEMDGELLEVMVSEPFAGEGRMFHTIAVGHGPNEEGLRAMAKTGGGQAMRSFPGEPAPLTVVRMQRAMQSALLEDIEVKVTSGKIDGLTPAMPMRMAHGEQLAIMGVTSEPATIEVSGTYRGKSWKRQIDLAANKSKEATSPQVARFWARNRISDMLSQNAPRPDVVALSLEYGVMSPYTSFLVLENQEAYDKYQIERRKENAQRLAEQQGQEQPGTQGNLAKSDDDLQALLEKPDAKPKPKEMQLLGGEEGRFGDIPKAEGEMVDEINGKNLEVNKALGSKTLGSGALKDIFGNEEGFDAKMNLAMSDDGDDLTVGRGAGGMGMRGTGRGGGGEGFGRIGGLGKADTGGGKGIGGFAAKKKKKPVVIKMHKGTPTLSSSCKKGNVLRTVNAKSRVLQYCYERVYRYNPGVAGKIVARWKIDLAGSTEAPSVVSSTMGNEDVERCIVRAIRRMRFERPDREACVVEYPLVFNPAPGFSPDDIAAKALARLLQDKNPDVHTMQSIIDLHVQLGQTDKARAAFKKYSKSKKVEDPLDLLSTMNTAVALVDDYAKLVKERLGNAKKIQENALVASRFASTLGRAKKIEVFLEFFGKEKLPSPFYASAANAYLIHDHSAFTEVWEAWSKLYSPEALLETFKPMYYLADTEAYNEAMFGLMAQLGGENKLPEGDLKRFIDLSSLMKKPDASSKQVIAYCATAEGLDWCIDNASAHLEGFADKNLASRTGEELGAARDKAIAKLHDQRSQDMGNVAQILRIAKIYERLEKPRHARRVMSEIVEFSPHDYNTRMRYAKELRSQTKVVEACSQYAIAVQLDPKQRDTFREMVSMRRTEAGEAVAKELRECVIDGVSKLPVKRSLSMVLTWEDPSADVDLHVHENNGKEHVWYRERESKNGGLLYYDITDGYGPEIYVLGSGPVGEYVVGVVYYSGMQKNLKAKLTVLRNAGAPNETRTTYDVVLPEANSDVSLGVTKIQLDASDRSIDGSKVVDP